MNEKTTSQQLLGQNLKATRVFLGLSQMKLAEKCDLSTNFISELEGGKAWVSAETLDRIASILEVPPHTLFLPATRPDTASLEKVLSACLRIIEDNNEKTAAEIKQELLKLRK